MTEAIMNIFEDINTRKQKIQEIIELKKGKKITLQTTNIELK